MDYKPMNRKETRVWLNAYDKAKDAGCHAGAAARAGDIAAAKFRIKTKEQRVALKERKEKEARTNAYNIFHMAFQAYDSLKGKDIKDRIAAYDKMTKARKALEFILQSTF